MSSEHFVVRCKDCQRVFSTCRCPAPDKRVIEASCNRTCQLTTSTPREIEHSPPREKQ